MFRAFGQQRRQAPYVPTLILLNVAVYLLWAFWGDVGGHGGAGQEDALAHNFMNQNFLVSWTALTEGRIWVLVTSAFSHNMLWHLLLNMFVLSSFGPIVEMSLGPRQFIRFYLFASVVSGLGHALVSALLLGEPAMPALGASGAISGVILLFALLYPREKILLFGIIPLPALFGALAFVGLDIWGLVEQAGGGGLPIGHGAHLGGALAGALWYFSRRNTRQLS